MSQNNKHFPWVDRIGNPAQIGGIETSIIDNGPGRGTRIAWINTGTGLRYKLVIDRAMDIADAFYNQHSLAWLSHTGITAGRSASVSGLEWLYSFGGGLLATCGLTHMGGPEDDETGHRGLHGRISNTAAVLESICQPDPAMGKLDMSITGTVKETKLFGPNFELRRTVSGTLGQPRIRIEDTVTNRGSTTWPHMMLYHCNFGWPLADAESEFIWKGNWASRGNPGDDEIFNENHDFMKCQPPMDSHATGEACVFIDPKTDDEGFCNIGLINPKLSLAVRMKYDKKQLPWLTNWQHWGKGEYVTGIEPGTNPPIGQNKAKQQGQLIYLEPGQSRSYKLEIEVLTDKNKIDNFKAKGL